MADIVDPLTGAVVPVTTQRGGLLYTRTTARFVLPGARLGTIAVSGAAPPRQGRLLSA